MFKKSLLVLVASLTLTTVCCFADGIPNLPPPDYSAITLKDSWFVAPSISYVYMNMPTLSYFGVDGVSGRQKVTFDPSFHAALPGLVIGKHVTNDHFFPQFFGSIVTFSSAVSYLQNKTSDVSSNLGNIVLFNINGSGIVPTLTATPFNNARFWARQQLLNAGFFISGYKFLGQYRSVSVSRTLSLGFYYRNLKQHYNIDSSQSLAGGASLDYLLNEDANSNYYGPQLSDRINLIFNHVVSGFISGSAALLFANTNFCASQKRIARMVAVIPVFNSVANDNHKTTYRFALQGGISLNPTPWPIRLTFAGGAELMGYVPQIINPSRVRSQPAHVDGAHKVNPFATITLTAPF